MVKFYMLSYVVVCEDEIQSADSLLGYTTGPTFLEELTPNIKLHVETANAKILLQSVQFLTKEAYSELGGHLQPGLS